MKKCKYCGTALKGYSDICTTCRTKLDLIRKLQAMVRKGAKQNGQS
jgi:hypothetical protein